LIDRQSQIRLPVAAGVPLNETFNKALDMEAASPWSEPRRLEGMKNGVAPRPGWTHEEIGRRAAVALPGSQTPGIAVNGMALRRPHLKLPLDNHGATASGQSSKKILTEVSAGTSLMTARMVWNINADSTLPR
jgi:hypothetical protein